MSKLLRPKRPLIETLEPRLLFSATADIAVFDDGSSDAVQLSNAADQLDLTEVYPVSSAPLTEVTAASSAPDILVVVDTAVRDYEMLVDDIRQQYPGNNLQIIYLDAASDGLSQITQQLTQFSELDSLHIISHGASGTIALGSTLLSANNLFTYEEELLAWRSAFSESADILLYGCDVSATQEGQAFVARIAELTGADVAASDDATGHSSLNGDWDLEFAVGEIENSALVSAAAQESWVDTLASNHYINIQGSTSAQSVSSTTGVGQSFLVDNAGATYLVNQISLQMRLEPGAANQDITIQLLDGGWNDATPLASQTFNSNQLDSTFGWQTVNFGDVTLNQSQTYIIKVTTNNADGKVSVAYRSDAWNNSEMIVNGTGNSANDLNILVSYNNGSNQAPVNTVPGAQTTNQNTPLIFSNLYGNRIQVADADAFPNDIEVTLSAGQGSFSLAQTTGLTFTNGDGTSDFNMVFRGSVSEVNAALATITYTPVTNYTGGDTFSITTKDLGLNGGQQDSDNIAITINNVNDAPTVSITETNYAVDEQTLLNLHTTGIVVNDSDGDTLSVTISAPLLYSEITAAVGTTGVIISSGNGSNSLVLTGTSAQLNNLFAGNNGGTLTYRANSDTPAATETLTISASDGSLSANDTATINITAVNDAPVNTVPAAQVVNEDTSLVFSAANGNQIQIADVDVAAGNLEVVLTITNGALSLAQTTGLTFNTGDGTGDSTLVFSGSIANINAALATITYAPTANYSGPALLTLTTNDQGNTGSGAALQDVDTVDITVTAVNDTPTLDNPIGDQNATEDSAFNFQFAANTFADADVGAMLTYSAQLNGGGALPAWLNFDSATRTFSGTPSNTDVGVITIDVIADDGSGGTVTDTFAITVANTNDAPTVANAIADQNATEDSAFNFQFAANTFADVDAGATLTYSAQLNGGGALPAWLTFDSTTRTFSGTPTNADVGVITIDVIADDGNGGTVTDTFTITVANTNDAPTVANAIADQNATEDSAFNFQFAANTFADADAGAILTYSAQLNGGGTLPAWLSFDSATRTFSGTPTNADVGTLSIDVIADDGNGGTVTDTFAITVANTNDAPTVANAIADQNATEDSAFNFQFAANTFADADAGAILTYSAQLNGGGALPAWLTFDSATRTFSGTPTNTDVGVITIDVIADDGNGGTVTDTFAITVANTNDAPTVANAIADQNATEDSAFNFQFAANTFADADAGAILTYSAQLNGGGALPAWLSFDSATRTFSGTPSNTDVGVITIDVIVDDGNGGTITDTFAITVANTNDAPTVANAIADQNATEDSAFNFQFAANTFADVDAGAILTYSAQLNGGGALPAWLTFDSATRTFSGTPTNADVGTLSIDVIADDGNGGTITDTFAITVANTNDAPTVANAIADQNATEDSAFNFQFAANTFTDADAGAILTYSAQLNGGGALPAWLTFDSATRTFSGTPTNTDVGVITIDVIADDGNGGTITDTFAITVANTNDAPTVANAIADQNATEDSAFNFQFAANTFADADAGAILTYSAQLNGGGALPAWLTFDSATRTFSGTPTNADVGALSIDLIADDGNGGTVTDTFTITVNNLNNPPTLANAIADQNATEDSAFNFQFAANTFADADAGAILTYSAQLNGGGALPAWLTFDSATRTFSGTPTNADVGVITIDVIADDGNGGTVTDTFAITVANTNDAPTVANAIADQNATEDSAFNFQFAANTFADADAGAILTYSAQLNGGGALPAWLTFDSATRTFSGTPVSSDVGTLSIDVIADDGSGGTATDTFTITVNNLNNAPTLANAIADQNATEDSVFNFQFAANTFADADAGAILTYSAQLNGGGALPTWLAFDSATRTFSGTPTNADVGVITIDVIADDGNGGTVTDTFAITVANTNDAPTVANAIADQNATEDSAFNFQFAANTFTDADAGAILTYSAQLNGGGALPAWLTFDSATRTFSGTPTNSDVGVIVIAVTATDGNGGAATATFNMTIAEAEPVSPPVITPTDPDTGTPTRPDPIIPPVIPPVVTPPVTSPPDVVPPVNGGNDLGGNPAPEDSTSPTVPPDRPLVVETTDNNTFNPVDDKSARDYERAEELLNRNALPVSSLTASPSLVSLIVPDAGFAPWEAADFDNEVRRIRAQMDDALEEEQDRRALIAGISFSLTTGLLIWSLRAGSLLLAMVSMLPLWRGLDPLPILEQVNKRKRELEQQRKDRKNEDKSAKEVGYLFDHVQQKNKDI
jgi:hypothetical protein